MLVSSVLPVSSAAAQASGATLSALPEVTMSVTSSRNDYGCTLIRQSPPDWYKMKPRQDFDINWTVQNSGNHVWPSTQTKIKYISGTKFQTHGSEFPLASSVGLGKKNTFSIDMVAPRTPGYYSTVWALYAGNTRFCTLTLVVRVSR